MSASSAASEIPLILTNRSHLLPPPESTLLGTQNFSNMPKAVIFGGAFEDEDVKAVEEAMNSAVDEKGSPGLRVPLLKADRARATKPMGPEYAKEVEERLLRCLEELRNGEGGGFERQGVVWF
jgi:hypothetical protein